MSFSQNVVSLHPLKVIVLPGFGVPEEARNFYNVAYDSWKSVWKQTLLELDGSDKLFSDHFTRQDYHLTIFHGSRCVAAVSFRRANLHSSADLEDSWLKIWPKEILDIYKSESPNAAIMSWFYVDPEYRRAESGNHLADLQVSSRVAEMVCFLSRELQLQVSFAGVRNNRSVNKLVEQTGCQVLLPGVVSHGVEVDLVAWLPDKVESSIQNFSELSHRLWDNRLVFNSEVIQLLKPRSRRRTA